MPLASSLAIIRLHAPPHILARDVVLGIGRRCKPPTSGTFSTPQTKIDTTDIGIEVENHDFSLLNALGGDLLIEVVCPDDGHGGCLNERTREFSTRITPLMPTHLVGGVTVGVRRGDQFDFARI